MSQKALANHVFELKLTAKQLQRESKRCEKEEATERSKVKKAIQQGNTEGAQIYAENAIRKKTESIQILRLSSRIDAVASKLQTRVTMGKVTGTMGMVVKNLGATLASNNLEKISMVMDTFEKQFEDLDVQSQYIQESMGTTTTTSTPQDQVRLLMQQVADEHGLELNMALPNASNAAQPVAKESSDLNERLAALRNHA